MLKARHEHLQGLARNLTDAAMPKGCWPLCGISLRLIASAISTCMSPKSAAWSKKASSRAAVAVAASIPHPTIADERFLNAEGYSPAKGTVCNFLALLLQQGLQKSDSNLRVLLQAPWLFLHPAKTLVGERQAQYCTQARSSCHLAAPRSRHEVSVTSVQDPLANVSALKWIYPGLPLWLIGCSKGGLNPTKASRGNSGVPGCGTRKQVLSEYLSACTFEGTLFTVA